MNTVADRAELLQREVNEAIAEACSKGSPLQWKAIAERIAGERIDDQWEWLLVEMLNASPPTIAIIAYKG